MAMLRDVMLGDISLEWPFLGRDFSGRHLRIAILGGAIAVLGDLIFEWPL